MVDRIVWDHYGRRDRAALEVVFLANPGLAGYGAILPGGVLIELPELPDPTPARGVRLWD